MKPAHPLKTYRAAQSISQGELAELLGVTRTTVARWETGARKVDRDLIPSISATTGISAKKLRPDLAELFKIGAAA